MLSTKRTNLAVLNGVWVFPPRAYCEERTWWPNRVAYTRHQPIEALINVMRRNLDRHFALSVIALQDVIAAEKAGKIIQAYVRLAEADNTMAAQETAQNVLRKLSGTPPIPGRFGEYWWLNADFQPQEAVDPTVLNCPI